MAGWSPFSVESKFRPVAIALTTLFYLGVCALIVLRCYQILNGPPSLRFEVKAADEYGSLPDFAVCAYSDLSIAWKTVSFKAQYTAYQCPYDPFFIVKDFPVGRDCGGPAVTAEIRGPQQWLTGSYSGCAILNVSGLQPWWHNTTLQARRLYMFFEGESGLFGKDVPNWDTLEFLAIGKNGLVSSLALSSPVSVEARPAVLDLLQMTKSTIVHEDGSENYRYTAVSNFIKPHNFFDGELQNYGATMKVAKDGKVFDEKHGNRSNLVAIKFAIDLPTGETSTFVHVPQTTRLFQEIGTAGGYITLITFVMGMVFVKKYPNHAIHEVIEERTLFGSQVEEVFEHIPRASVRWHQSGESQA